MGDAVGPTMYYGAGAGAQPTASAVVADLVDVTRMHTADPENRDPTVVGTRRFLDALADERRLSATAIQTVGSKGWDGFTLAIVDR